MKNMSRITILVVLPVLTGFCLLMGTTLMAQAPGGNDGNHNNKPGYKMEGSTEADQSDKTSFVTANDNISVMEILSRAKATRDTKRKRELGEQLGTIHPKTENDVRQLFNLIEDKELSWASQCSLRKVKYEERYLAPVFIENLKHQNVLARILAAETLGIFKSTEAVQNLIDVVKHAKIERVKGENYEGIFVVMAMMSLGKIGDESAIPVIMAQMKDEQLRSSVDIPLLEFGKKALRPILNEARDNQDEDIRECYINMIRGMQGKEAAPDLLAVVKDRNNPLKIRQNAIEALGYIGDKDTIEGLGKEYDGFDDYTLKGMTMSVYGRTKNKNGLPLALKEIKDKDEILRSVAVSLLGEIGDESVVPLLKDALNDSDKEVRYEAAKALKKMTGKDYEWRGK